MSSATASATRRARDRAAMHRMTQLMLQGWTMTGSHCPVCTTVLLRAPAAGGGGGGGGA